MKSPPLLDWLTGSGSAGGIVSAAASLGPGTAAFGPSFDGPDAGIFAETGLVRVGVVRAAAPASVAPLRKLRRPLLAAGLRFDMDASQQNRADFNNSASDRRQSLAAFGRRQE
jgi:hypothetical protein